MGIENLARRGTARTAALGAVLLLAIALGAAGARRVRQGELVVSQSAILRLPPHRLRPGWTWRPPLLWRVLRYPVEPDLDWTGPPSAAAGGGATPETHVHLRLRLREKDLLSFHQTLGPDWRRSLRGAVEIAVADAMREVRDPTGSGREEVGEYVRARLEGALMRSGAGIEDLTVAPAMRGPAGRPPSSGRILLVGLDGLDWRVADPLMKSGRMPNLSRIVRAGVRARLRTISPTLSPVIWTTMATGVEPERHGILDFVAPGPDGKPIPVTSDQRRVPALWNILSEAGLRVGFVAWWATWPAEQVNGVMVSDRLAYTLFGLDREKGPPEEGLARPAGLMEELRPLVVDPSHVTVRELGRFVHLPGGRFPEDASDLDRLDELRRSLAATRTYEAVALHLLETRRFRLFAVYFEGTDVISHLFMPYRPPIRAGVDPARFDMYRDAVDEAYVWHDEILGRIIRAAGGDDLTVVVVSDHGFRTDEDRPPGDARIGHGRAAEWHRKYGVLAMAGPPVREGVVLQEAGVLDVAPTLAELLGVPVAADWPGKVLSDALTPEFREGHPVRTIASYGMRGPEVRRPAAASSTDAALLEKLASLGYITPSGPAPAGKAAGAAKGESAQEINNRGSALLASGRRDEAEAAFRRTLRMEPGFVGARANLGLVLTLGGRLDEAEAELRRALDEDPGRVEIYDLLGGVLDKKGDRGGAERLYRKALEIAPNDTDALNGLGLLLEDEGRLGEAAGVYRRTVEVDPDYALGWNNLGNTIRRLGRREEAEAMYRRAIRADPDFVGSYNNLGLLLQEEGRFEEAAGLYEEGLRRAPGHPEVLNNLASLHQQMGRTDEAAAEYRRLIEEHPDYAEAHNNLGVLYGEMGDRSSAMEEYRRALEVRPDYPDALHNLGLALMGEGRTEEAEGRFLAALKLRPDYVSAYRNLGVLQMRDGRYAQALRTVQTGLEHTPGSAGLLALEGVILGRMGRAKEACRALARSLEEDPSSEEAREAAEGMGCAQARNP